MEQLIKRIIRESVMGKFVESHIPQLNNLKRKSNYSSRLYGSNVIYYDKDSKEYYFRVAEPRDVYYWDEVEDKYIFRNVGKTLYILKDLYNEISDFIPNDDMILKWFNEKYKQDAERLQTHYTLKQT
jgi:hypothetical protein